MIGKIAGLVLLISTIVGCSSTDPAPTTVKASEVTVDIPQPQPLSLRAIEWSVIQTKDGTYFALTPQEYEELGLNMQDILRFIRESKAYFNALQKAR